MSTSTTNNSGTSAGTNTAGNGKSRAQLTPVLAISKISKILEQLAPSDRKRVLQFLSASGESSE